MGVHPKTHSWGCGGPSLQGGTGETGRNWEKLGGENSVSLWGLHLPEPRGSAGTGNKLPAQGGSTTVRAAKR